MGKYDDIINLPHHVSQVHKPMPMEKRAAQFAPFAALSGHDEAISETSRVTEDMKELSDIEITKISRKLNYALENKIPVKINYFVPDKSKTGGSYQITRGIIKKWDELENTLLMKDGNIIHLAFISEIDMCD